MSDEFFLRDAILHITVQCISQCKQQRGRNIENSKHTWLLSRKPSDWMRDTRDRINNKLQERDSHFAALPSVNRCFYVKWKLPHRRQRSAMVDSTCILPQIKSYIHFPVVHIENRALYLRTCVRGYPNRNDASRWHITQHSCYARKITISILLHATRNFMARSQVLIIIVQGFDDLIREQPVTTVRAATIPRRAKLEDVNLYDWQDDLTLCRKPTRRPQAVQITMKYI